VDGKTGSDGVNIPGIARVMMYFSAVEAVNLDGGSTVTLVVNGTVVNAPSDAVTMPGSNGTSSWLQMTAAKAVSTVLCLKYRQPGILCTS
jgi:L-serine deaminase